MDLRNLILILGDQLDPRSLALENFDASQDLVWMAELPEESEHVWSHKARTALFFSAMRHFARGLEERDVPVCYPRIGAHPYGGFTDALAAGIAAEHPQHLVVVEPGDYRVVNRLREVASSVGLPLEVRRNSQFLIDLPEFQDWAKGRKGLRLEHFYRYVRRRMDVLMNGKDPEGGAWNFDKENRKTFGRQGPGAVPAPTSFPPDTVTKTAIADVQRHFPDHPGSLAHFDWPVTPEQAEAADMRCLAETIGQTLDYGYAHHIQRLMITGLFALLLGVEPRQVHAWYLAVYVDAVEWVELPNVLGMSQFADGGLMGSKPYVASGKYIQRMSNYCTHCPYDPAEATGKSACPFTTLYWDFLMRHEARFKDHPRAGLQWRNLSRLDEAKRAAIRRRAEALKRQLAPSSS